MKKIIPFLLISMSLALVVPAFASNVALMPKTENPANKSSQEIMDRLIAIRDMDKSNLTNSEKKELRQEVKELKKESKKKGIILGLGIGAIIIIILLIVLL